MLKRVHVLFLFLFLIVFAAACSENQSGGFAGSDISGTPTTPDSGSN